MVVGEDIQRLFVPRISIYERKIGDIERTTRFSHQEYQKLEFLVKRKIFRNFSSFFETSRPNIDRYTIFLNLFIIFTNKFYHSF